MLGLYKSRSKGVMVLGLFSFTVLFSGLGLASEYPQFQADSNNTGFTNDVGIPNEVDSVTEYKVGSNSIYSSPVVAEEQVYMGTNYGRLVAVWRENGTRAWYEDIGGDIQGAPVYTEDKVFAAGESANGDGGVFSVWRENGSFIEGRQQDDLGGDVETPLTKKGDHIYLTLLGDGTELVALNMDGLEDEWRYDTGIEIDAGPAVTEDRAFVYDENEVLHAVNRTDGSELWTDQAGDGDSSRGNAPTIANGTVYVVSDNGEVFAYDIESGEREWGPLGLGDGVTASPAYHNGSLYLGVIGGDFHRINASEGTIERTETLPNGIGESPTVTRDRIYVGTLQGAMYALDKEDFSIVWEETAGSELAYSGSAVSDNQVFFTSWDSRLYILEGPTPDTEPPGVTDQELVDRTDSNGAVKDADKVSVYANVTDDSEITSVTADLSDFGSSGSASMETEVSAGFDWDSDGELSEYIYGVNATVSEDSSNDGTGKSATITAEDEVGNIDTTDSFGDLILDTVAPEFDDLNVSYVSTLNPIFELNFTDETSGLSDDSRVEVTDPSGNLFDNSISDVTGVDVNGMDTIMFDFDEREDSLEEGTVQVDVDAEDVAGNQEESISETFEVDSTPPSDLQIMEPDSQTYLSTDENLSLRYSYTEENPYFTAVRFFDQEGVEDGVRNFSESSVDPDETQEIFLENESHNFESNSTYDIYIYAEDLAENSNSITENKLLTIDDFPPVLNESEKTGEKTFDFNVSDNEALNVSSIEASDFEFKTESVSGSFDVDSCESLTESCTVSVTLDELADTDEIKVGLSSDGNISDAADNVQEDDNVTVTGMDEVPPDISDTELVDSTDGDGIVTADDYVRVSGNVTDGEEIDYVESNLTEFDLGDVTLESEASAGIDWNGDGSIDDNVFGANRSVPESAEDGEDRNSWIEASDTSSNVNVSDAFGSLEVDNTDPVIDILNPNSSDPVYIQPDEDFVFDFVYTEENPEVLNVSLGSESIFFDSLSSGTDSEVSRTFQSDDFPDEGVYDLELALNDSVSQEGSDLEEESVFIDGTPPDNVSDLEHVDDTANEGYDDDTETNFTWTEASDDLSGVAEYIVYVSKDGGDSFNSGESVTDLNYTVDSSDGDKISVKVQAVDKAGNKGDNKTSEVIEVDTVPPEVDIYTPVAEDDIVNSTEASDFKVNGTVSNDNTGEVAVNISDEDSNSSRTVAFSDQSFEASMDASMLAEGNLDVEAVATDDAGNTGSIDLVEIVKDTEDPELGEAYRINTTAFNVSFSDVTTGLDPGYLTESEFGLDPGSFETVSTEASQGDNEGNVTVRLNPVDSEKVNFSVEGGVRDVAGNILRSGWREVENMDSVPPSFDYLNLSDWNGDGFVSPAEKVKVFANISDGTGVESAQANLTEFDAGDVNIESETSSGFDWNDDGELSENVYGGNATVGENAESGTGVSTVTAMDNSSNSNENTSEEFGELEIVKEDPELNITDPLEVDPVYLKESDDLDVFFDYTEENPEELNISVGPETTSFNDLSGGENVETSRTVPYTELPGNGSYDLELNLSNTAGLYGNDSEASSVLIDSFAPEDLSIDSPDSKRYLQSSDDFSVEYSYTEDNPGWTVVSLVNESGDEGLKINVSESESDPSGTVEFTELEKLNTGVNYTVELEVQDKVERMNTVSESDLLVVDDKAPELVDPRKDDEKQYSFDVFDNQSGLSTADLSEDDIEIKEGVEASISLESCSNGAFNCTVGVEILEDTNEGQLTAQITESTGSIFDLSGNARYEDEVILEDTDTLGPALEDYNLNVSTPVNDSYTPGEINVTLKFNESMNTSREPTVDINNLETSYTASGSYMNSTHWSGVFEIRDEDEHTQAFINVSDAEDKAGNSLLEENNSDKFDVDTEEPVIKVLNDFNDQNLSGEVDLTSYFEETTSNGFIDSYEYREGGWNNIESPSTWDSSEASSGETDFRVNASDDTGNRESTTETSTVDNSPPEIEEASILITDDAGDEGVLNKMDNFTVEINASDSETDISEASVNVSEVSDLSGFTDLSEEESGNFTGEFTVNQSASIEEYSPEIKVSDSESNDVENETNNSVEVNSLPVEVAPDTIYTLIDSDRFDNGIVNPGDVMNVSWNSSETDIDNIQQVEVDFGRYGGVVEASDVGDGIYSASTTVEEGTVNGEGYSGNVEVTTSSETDNATDDSSVPVNNEIPSAPGGLDASTDSGNIELSFDNSVAQDVDSYVIYRNESRIGTSSNNFYEDTGVEDGKEYVYTVATVDNASNEGDNSSEASEVADGEAPFVSYAETYNTTAINVTLKDELNEVSVDDTNIIGIDGNTGYYTDFADDAQEVEGLFVSDEGYGTGAEPEITVDLQDNVGNSRGFDYTVTADDGIRPEVKTIDMENVTADKEASLEVVYTEEMDETVDPDVIVSGVDVASNETTWETPDTFRVDFTFEEEGEASGTVVVGNASDDSGNVQEEDVSDEINVDTVVPEPVIEDLESGEIYAEDVLLNMSIENDDDVSNVRWKYDNSGNVTVEELGSVTNETVWETPDVEKELKLWLEASDSTGNTGTDSVQLEVDNIHPELTDNLPEYVTGVIDLDSAVTADESVTKTYEYNTSDGWDQIDNFESWDSSEASDGEKELRVNATDDAGNLESSVFDIEIDNTPPSSFSLEDGSDRFLQGTEDVEIRYSYEEENPDNTTFTVSDQAGTTVEQFTVDESSVDPSGVETIDTEGLSGNYSVDLKAYDQAGQDTDFNAFEMYIDDEDPELGNGTFYSNTTMSFQVIDSVSGINSSTVDSSSFEVVTDSVEASEFDVIGCSDGSNRCDVNVSLENESSYAEIGVTDSVTDRTGNEVQNTVYIIDPDIDGPQANMSLNVSEPYSLEDAGRDVELALSFSREVDETRPYIDFLGASEDYDLRSGSYVNSTYWEGVFTVVNNSQEDDITVNATEVQDEEGNYLIEPEVGEFSVDMKPPEINLSGLSENVSGTINLTDKIMENSTGIDALQALIDDSPVDTDQWNTTGLDDGDKELEFNAEDDAGNSDAATATLTVDNSEPVIESAETEALDSEPLTEGDSIQLAVNASDNGTGLSEVTANISQISTQEEVKLALNEDGNYSKTVEIDKNKQIDEYQPRITVSDYAGNDVEASASAVEVDSTTQEDEEDDSDDESDGGGSSGGGGGGGALPEDDSDDDSDEGSDSSEDNESDTGDSNLDPGDEFEIDVNPDPAFLESETGEDIVYRPEISVSEEASVQLELRGLEFTDYSEEVTVEEDEQLEIGLGSQESEGVFEGRLIASAKDKSATAGLSIDVSKRERQTDVRADMDDGELRLNSSVDVEGEVNVTTTVYDDQDKEVLYRTGNATSDENGVSATASADSLEPGTYTVETRIEDAGNVYTATDRFTIEEPFNPVPFVIGAVLFAVIITGLYTGINRFRTRKVRNNVSSSPEFRSHRQARESVETSQTRQEKVEEKDPFKEIQDMFQDDEIIRDVEEARQRFSEGRLSEADEKLREARDSGFFDSESINEVKDKVRKVHRKFEKNL